MKKHSRRRAAILGMVAAAGLSTAAQAQSVKQEDPIPDSTRQSLVAIEKTFASIPTAEPLMLFPQIREQLKDAPAFLRDSKAGINFRTYYRDNVSNAPSGAAWNEAWAAGGSVAFETGRLFDLISGGFVLYTSFPVYAPLDHDGTGLLKPGQQQYGVLGQLYGKLHIYDTHEIIAGRYLYDTPFLGPHDNRMSPKTFYGYVLHGSFGDEASGGPYFRYGGGYIAAMKERNSTEFISMSRVAGASEDRGTGVLGGMFSWGPVRLGAIEYYNQDTINIFYTEGKYGVAFTPEVSAALSAQFAAQNSTGMNLLNGGTYWATNDFGIQAQLGFSTAILTAAYTVVNPGFNMQTPWSANPFYTDAQIQAFNRAGESAVMAGLSYVFTPLGLPGVGASVYYFRGWTQAPAAGLPVLEDEWNFNLEWRPNWKPLQGFWLRARYGYARIDTMGVRNTIDEVRLIANYTIKMY
ncbi:MAG: OprD family outer membrane porin [Proteobacteria bacterium]|nr:OprD family outer membrane porin [Pseudomonadota bacterium]